MLSVPLLFRLPLIVTVLPPSPAKPVPIFTVPLLVRSPPTPSLLAELLLSVSTLRLPLTVSPPLSESAAPCCSSKSPATLESPVSALLLLVAPLSATKACPPPTISLPLAAMLLIPPLANSSSDGPNRVTAELKVEGAAPEVRISSAAPLPWPNSSPTRLIVPTGASAFAVPTVAVAVSSWMLSVPLLFRLPLIVTVLPPSPAKPVPIFTVPLLVRSPPTASMLAELLLSVSTLRLPLTVSPPLSESAAPCCSSKSPATLESPVSALLLLVAPLSATQACPPPTISLPLAAMLLIPPLANSSSDG